jgi:hypothetical protein
MAETRMSALDTWNVTSCQRARGVSDEGAHKLPKVLSLAVALSDGRIPAAQYRCNGTADNVTSAKYDSICSRKRDARRLEQAQDAGWRARREQWQGCARR